MKTLNVDHFHIETRTDGAGFASTWLILDNRFAIEIGPKCCRELARHITHSTKDVERLNAKRERGAA